MEKADQDQHKGNRVRKAKVPSGSQDLAMRIWDGQSPDLPLIDRVTRIKNALAARGMDLNITLPADGFHKYL